MARSEVEMTVTRNGRVEGRDRLVADTSDASELEGHLKNWLQANSRRFGPSLWPDFEATFYGSPKVTVRVAS
jgi:hypothetical protein